MSLPHGSVGVKLGPGRKLTVLDAMVLIAATGIGLGWTRMTFDANWRDLTAEGVLQPSFIVQASFYWKDLAVPYLTSFTIALALLCIRRPRPALRTLSRRPGAVACMAVTAWVLVTVAFNFAFYLFASCLPGGHAQWFLWFPDLLSHTEDGLSRYAQPRAESIAVCWCLLGLSGRWRSQPTWLDRGSRLVGMLWLVAAVPEYFFCLSE
jgi:hypothetical protein